jgi:hypothetical protein
VPVPVPPSLPQKATRRRIIKVNVHLDRSTRVVETEGVRTGMGRGMKLMSWMTRMRLGKTRKRRRRTQPVQMIQEM